MNRLSWCTQSCEHKDDEKIHGVHMSVNAARRSACATITKLILLGFGLVVRGAEPTWIDKYLEEATAMNKVCGAKEYPACRDHLLRLDELLDGRADIVYRLAKAEAMLGHKAAALDRLSTFSKSGLTFADPASDPEFASLKNSPEFETMLARLKAAREPRSASKPFLTLPERDLIAEDIAYDSIGDKFYVSSVRHRKILSLDKQGSSAEFVREGQADVWAILALVWIRSVESCGPRPLPCRNALDIARRTKAGRRF